MRSKTVRLNLARFEDRITPVLAAVPVALGPAHIRDATAVGDTLLFADSFGGNSISSRLWRTDGTEAGTVLLAELVTIQGLSAHNGRSFFFGDDGTHGQELWVSDGTAAGTKMVVDLNPGSGHGVAVFGSSPDNLITSNGQFVVFTGVVGANFEPFRSAGTAAGTVQLASLNAELGAVVQPGEYVFAGGTTYFVAHIPGGNRLFRTNGTPGGHVEIPLGEVSGGISTLIAFDGGVIIPDGGTRKLFRYTSGAAEPTVLKAFPDGSSVLGTPFSYFHTGVVLNFEVQVADGATVNSELWRTNGTPGGTSRVGIIQPDIGTPASPRVVSAADVNGRLFYTIAYDGTDRNRLFTSDNASTLTELPARFDQVFAAGGTAVVTGTGSLVASDGTAPGTRTIPSRDPLGDYISSPTGSTFLRPAKGGTSG